MKDMREDSPDKLHASLASLPVRDASGDLARRTRSQALAHLALQRAYGDRPWLVQILFVWSHVVMPIALASVVGVYLTWAFAFASNLYK